MFKLGAGFDRVLAGALRLRITATDLNGYETILNLFSET